VAVAVIGSGLAAPSIASAELYRVIDRCRMARATRWGASL